MLRIQIETTNDAFQNPGEIANILRGLAMNFDDTPNAACHGRLRDSNGNTCGSYDFTPEAAEPRSYRLDTRGNGGDLDDARFPTLADAEEVQEATEYGGDGYFAPKVVPCDDAPNMTAAEYLAGAWPEYPGKRPEGVDPEEWFSVGQ